MGESLSRPEKRVSDPAGEAPGTGTEELVAEIHRAFSINYSVQVIYFQSGSGNHSSVHSLGNYFESVVEMLCQNIHPPHALFISSSPAPWIISIGIGVAKEYNLPSVHFLSPSRSFFFLLRKILDLKRIIFITRKKAIRIRSVVTGCFCAMVARSINGKPKIIAGKFW